jgi:Amt family ammonium transporter
MVNVEGLFVGGSWEFLIKQAVSVIAVGAYCFIFTYFVLKLINYITPVKVTKQEEEAGMDASLHGEIAYED